MPDIAVMEWAGALLRWAHVITALAWIGASFYLISWENKFNREHGLREGVEGDFWTIQGGDFYFVEKLRSAPASLPARLHWFKYEAYFTWLTGFALMCIFYYARAPVMLLSVDSPVQGTVQAVAASVALLTFSWLAYAAHARMALARNLVASAVIGVVFVGLLAWISGWLFNGRASVLHVGAALGGIMSANVFFVIIPWHKRLLRAIEADEPLEDLYRDHPGFRSRHNHYLTLPVLFLMLGIHLPLDFEGPLSWLVVAFLALSMGLLKHFHTQIQRSKPAMTFLFAGLIVFASAVLIDAAFPSRTSACAETVATDSVMHIVDQHCSSCHQAGQVPALDGPAELVTQKVVIRDLVLRTRAMPPGNPTGMTDAERAKLACWLSQQEVS